MEFANPKLRQIAVVAKVHKSRSIARAIFLELRAWLVITGSLFAGVVSLFFLPSILPFFALILMFYLFSFVVIPFFAELRRRARRNRIVAHGNLHRDSRDPVLYLRPFFYDFTSDPERPDQTTDEEFLSSVFEDIGPVVAVGDPNEDKDPDKSFPIPGASRIYLKDNDWQTNLEKLMLMSQLIVIHMGTSKGITWEIGAAARQVGPSKLLISLLSLRGSDDLKRRTSYSNFKGVAEIELNKSLRTFVRLPDSIGNAIFIAFNPDWTPRLITVNEWKRRFFRFSFSSLLRETLRPVLKERDLKLSWRRTSLYILFIVLFCYGLVSPVILWFWFEALTNSSLFVIVLSSLPALLSYTLLVTYELEKGMREHLDRLSQAR